MARKVCGKCVKSLLVGLIVGAYYLFLNWIFSSVFTYRGSALLYMTAGFLVAGVMFLESKLKWRCD